MAVVLVLIEKLVVTTLDCCLEGWPYDDFVTKVAGLCKNGE